MCLGAAQNAAGLLVLRFLLGVLEAPSYPAFTIINTMRYKKAEQPLRMALALADFAIREAFTDYKTYLLVLFVLSIHVPTGGVVAFGAQIVSGLGFSTLETMLLSIPTGATLTLSSFMVSVPQLWFKNKRCLAMGLCCIVPVVCCSLLQNLPHENKVGRLLAYYFFYFFWGPYATGLSIATMIAPKLTFFTAVSLPMGNVSGHTKKLTVNASIFVAYCAANMIGTQVFFIHEAPNYPTGYNTLLGLEVAAICCITAYTVGCFMENKQRDRKEATNVSVGADEQFGDLTDYEKRGFRYLY
ncbi:hypothetical protein FALCPG4_010746 [Fusarium falciforme]